MMRKRASGRTQTGKALTAEFAVALTVFILIITFPLINLIGFGMAAGTQYILTVQCASDAGASTSFNDALSAMDREAINFAASGFGKFAGLHPVGGHNGTGTDLYLIETNLTGNSVLSFGPNTGGPTSIDPNNNVYEYQVRSTFDVGPFLSMSSVPFIGDVPGIGKPARLSFAAHRNCEFTEGLAMGASGTPLVASAGYGGGSGSSGTEGVAAGGSGLGEPTGSGAASSDSAGGGTTIAAASSNWFSNVFNSGGFLKKKKKGGTNTSSSSSSSSASQTQSGAARQSNPGGSTFTFGSETTSYTTNPPNSAQDDGGDNGTSGSGVFTPNGPVQTVSSNENSGQASQSFSYTGTTGPTAVGGLVYSSSQSGSQNQSQASTSSSSSSSSNSP